jgi:hypothetical protein
MSEVGHMCSQDTLLVQKKWPKLSFYRRVPQFALVYPLEYTVVRSEGRILLWPFQKHLFTKNINQTWYKIGLTKRGVGTTIDFHVPKYEDRATLSSSLYPQNRDLFM